MTSRSRSGSRELLETGMANVTVSIPDPVRDWIDSRIRSGEYADASEYLHTLIQQDRRRHEQLVAALIEGEQSGLSSRSVADIIAGTKAKLRNGAV
jgi:antitoxin ParD1/3/4